MQISLGFFLFDLGFCLHSHDESVIMLAHHACSISGLLYGIISGYCGTELVGALAGGELTNPSLQTRWFLLQTKQYTGSVLALVNDGLFTITFGIARVLFGSIHLYKVLASPNAHGFVKFGGVLLFIISFLWFCRVVHRWSQMLAAKKKSRQADRQQKLS